MVLNVGLEKNMNNDSDSNGVEYPLKELGMLLPRGGQPKYLTPQTSKDVLQKKSDYKEGSNCDVVIRVEKQQFSAHSSVVTQSSFLAGEILLHSKKDDKVVLDIHGVNFEAVKTLVDYMYGEPLAIGPENVQNIYNTATKLQLSDAHEMCYETIKNLICSSNCIAIFRLADREGWDKICADAWELCLTNFMHVIQSVGFLEAPKELVLLLLDQDRLCPNLGEDDCLSPEIHEKGILDAVLRYTEIQGTQEDFLVKMLKAVRLPLINKEELITLKQKFIGEGQLQAAEVVDEALVVHRHMSVPSINLSDLKWKRPRSAVSKLTTFLQYPGYLHGEVFSDHWTDPWIHVIGMKIWVKPSLYFQNKRVICGIKVYYSNGEAVEHGSRDEAKSSLYNFQLGEEERIVQVEKCRSCNSLNGILYNLINKLTFMTNKGHVYGVYINPSKEPDIFSAPSGVQYVHLAGIKGTYAEVNEEKYIDWLAFNWAYC